MRRDEVVALLRKFAGMKATVERLEVALETLDPCEGEIIDKMLVEPVPYASEIICEKYGIEVAAVYRRRNKALKKLGVSLGEMG